MDCAFDDDQTIVVAMMDFAISAQFGLTDLTGARYEGFWGFLHKNLKRSSDSCRLFLKYYSQSKQS